MLYHCYLTCALGLSFYAEALPQGGLLGVTSILAPVETILPVVSPILCGVSSILVGGTCVPSASTGAMSTSTSFSTPAITTAPSTTTITYNHCDCDASASVNRHRHPNCRNSIHNLHLDHYKVVDKNIVHDHNREGDSVLDIQEAGCDGAGTTSSQSYQDQDSNGGHDVCRAYFDFVYACRVAEDVHHEDDAYLYVDNLEHAQRDDDYNVDVYENAEVYCKGQKRLSEIV
ncbi:hypothetical protein LTR49_028271 [Elasticomyces elasticus]|nr:hypothetical protein LTR49_028271 [Elasticomyces elasticus]